jgi:mannose-6-phosphate isomerase-like protein (cupin superfamily)
MSSRLKTVVTQEDAAERTIRRDALISCNAAFIDCRTPGSDLKENYALIGSGVSQSSDQFINLQVPHGYNVGGAAMPNGVTNSLHLHFTAEVFLVVEGEYTFRWGADGTAGEFLGRAGDIVSVPTWIFRGFTNTGPNENFMFTVLGQDNTGGIIWGPSVLREAEGFGLHLTAQNLLIDTAAGQVIDPELELITPMPQEQIDVLEEWSAERMRSRLVTVDDRVWSSRALMCTAVDGGEVDLALIIGFGITEHRSQEPKIFNPHGFSLAVLRAEPGKAMLQHRTKETQVVIVRAGSWEVRLNDHDPVTVRLEVNDTLSIPTGAWRQFKSVGDDTGELYVITGGDGRAKLEWDELVVKGAQNEDVAYDANGYLAPWSLVSTTALDD